MIEIKYDLFFLHHLFYIHSSYVREFYSKDQKLNFSLQSNAAEHVAEIITKADRRCVQFIGVYYCGSQSTLIVTIFQIIFSFNIDTEN